jgi:hypothetical protein
VPRGYEGERITGEGYHSRDLNGTYLSCWDQNGERTGLGPLPVADNNNPISFYTIDGTHARLDITDPTNPLQNWTLSFADGRRIVNTPGVQKIYDANGTDANGNFITITSENDPVTTFPLWTKITDPLSREIQISYDWDNHIDTITAKGYSNAQLQWTVRWSTVASSVTYLPYGPEDGWGINPDPPPPAPLPQQFIVSRIELPAQMGGMAYTFGYDNTGELNSARLPSVDGSSEYAEATYLYDLGTNPDGEVYDAFLRNAVKQKTLTVSTNGRTPTTDTWTYSISSLYQDHWAWITAPDQGLTKVEMNAWGYPYKTTYPDGTVVEKVWYENVAAPMPNYPSGSQLQLASNQTDRDWPSGVLPAQNPFVGAEYTTVTGSIARQTLYAADRHGNISQTKEYDWVDSSALTHAPNGVPSLTTPGTLLRQTDNTYYGATGTTALCSSGYYCDPNASRVTSLLKSSAVSGPPGSKTEYCYEDPTARPNITVEAHWDSTKNALMPSSLITDCASRSIASSAIATKHWYDGTYGNRTDTRDANGGNTHYEYGSVGGQSNLYVTAVTTPDGKTTHYDSDLSSGLVKLVTDPNDVGTRTDYDPVGRPQTVTRAEGTADQSQTTYQYLDTAREVIATSDLDGSRQMTTTEWFDPLGRIKQQQQSGGSTAPIQVDTYYAYSQTAVSNAYQSSEQTRGWTVTSRDTMGRVVRVETFDGAALPAPWGGNAASTGAVTNEYGARAPAAGWPGTLVTSKDQNQVARKAYSDHCCPRQDGAAGARAENRRLVGRS